MAKDSAHLTFVGLRNGCFYFDECEQDEVDADMFELTGTLVKLIRCHNNKFLILNATQFDLKDLNAAQQSCSDYKLCINIYKEPTAYSTPGRAVILSAHKDNKIYAAVCTGDKVLAEEVDIQKKIEENVHKAVFYMIQDERRHCFKLKSSLYPDKYLGFDENDSNKLVLRQYDPENHYDVVTLV
ncbi:hypothetical protein WMY93_029358 [Mugilogobius chulae]|uniref:Interleukin-18 n=1 Tax=Mugilogobius chulae TaxID=88201 RepID=A0AAW0MV62_9GOBI